jgi:hypothetical protein
MPSDELPGESLGATPYLLEVESLDLGAEVRAVGLDLTEVDENREPARGPDAARVWSRILPAVAGNKPWTLDFYSHLDRVRDYCTAHHVSFRDATGRSLVIPAPVGAPVAPGLPGADELEALLDRFQKETFGARAGGVLPEPDPALEGELARRGVDAYHTRYQNYFFCAVCAFEDGSLVLLSEKIGAGEVIRRVRPALSGLNVELRLPA